MAVPDFQSVMLPFLEILQDGKERTMRDLTAALAAHFKLTEAQLQEHLPSGPQSLFYNRVAWAKTHLKNAGLIDNPVRASEYRSLLSSDARPAQEHLSGVLRPLPSVSSGGNVSTRTQVKSNYLHHASDLPTTEVIWLYTQLLQLT